METAELSEKTKDSLPPADLANVAAPPSVTENTTKHLDKIPRRSSPDE